MSLDLVSLTSPNHDSEKSVHVGLRQCDCIGSVSLRMSISYSEELQSSEALGKDSIGTNWFRKPRVVCILKFPPCLLIAGFSWVYSI